ncbi:MAG: tRNA (adenosine(37)-N6)-threonylcarbamoyltransferase complex ATPase subunit type 1 TsaE [Bacillota bacterium]
MQIETNNPQQTKELGRALGGLLQKGNLLLINGTLGAGKTTFIQGLALGLGIGATVTSPTFTIIHEYPGNPPLYHIDAYRIERETEIPELGLEEYFYGDGITAIEWPEKITAWLPEEAMEIKIDKVMNQQDKRVLTFTARGKKDYRSLLKELKRLASTGD